MEVTSECATITYLQLHIIPPLASSTARYK